MKRPPGLLRQDQDADVLLMIGTAGHVDHGKTRLVRFLTGCETDRLKTEKERGLSIELGFAPCLLGPGIAAGIVDVPGHEQFIKNMVAGAAGMDMTILVVAADDGVMPQTIEHLEIMRFLGVRHGLVALTKIDLVAPTRIEEIRNQIHGLVEGTFLEGVPICPVSSETLEGFDEFYDALTTVASAAKIARERGVFRLPVERVFSPPGHGTVATGIPLGGEITAGDEVEIQPAGYTARVRGIQRFLRDAETGRSGQCLALNLAGTPRGGVQRGDVIAHPGTVRPCRLLMVRLTTTGELATPLRDGERLRLHTGTVEAQAKLNMYGDRTLESDSSGFGAVQLGEPIAVSASDRFVLRRNSPAVTVAGGIVLRALDRRPRGARLAHAKELSERWSAFETPESRFEHHFIAAGVAGSSLREAAFESLMVENDARNVADKLVDSGALVPCPGTEHFLHKRGLEAGVQAVYEWLNRYYAEHPSAFGPSLDELAAGLRCPSQALETITALLVESGQLLRRENRVSTRKQNDKPQSARDGRLKQMEDLYREQGFVTSRPDELPGILHIDPATAAELLEHLCQGGILIRLGKNVVFHADWMREAERRVIDTIRTDGSLNSADFKNIIGASRKYALAILDHFDRIHVTQRFDNIRRLHPAYLRKNPELDT